MSQEGGDQDGKGAWYPGKFMGKAMKRSSSTMSPTSTASTASTTGSSQSSGVVNTPKTEAVRRSSVRPNPVAEQDTAPESGSTESALPRVPVGTVRIKIHEVRFLTIKSAKLSIEVDDMATVNLVSDWTYPIVRDFEMLNITSDIRLEFRGSGSTPYGVVLVPITSLLKFNGVPAPAKQTWREIYPYYEKALQDYPRNNLKFKSALSDLPGSAMNKPSISLGFVSFEAEVLLPSKVTNVLSLYLQPSPPTKNTSPPPLTDADYNEIQLAVNQAKLQRDIQRIKASLFKPPAAMEYFMSVPEIFVLILVLAFLILSVSSYQVPLVVTLLLLFNGIVAMSQRNTNAVVWNEPGVTLSNGSSITTGQSLSSSSQEEGSSPSRSTLGSLGSGAMTSIQAIVRTNQNLHYQILSVAHKLEIARNLLTFADPRISLIVFGYMFAFAVVSSVLIAILSISTYLVVLASTLLVISASYEFLGEQLESLPATSKYLKLTSKVGKFVTCLQSLLSKIPDEQELQHRKIAAAQIVKEGGAEMLDAAAAYQS